MFDITRHSTVLDNGITVLSEHAPHFNRSAIAVNVLAGGVHEREEQAGLAHLLEHLIFRGSQTRPGPVLQDEIEDLGGTVNGRTLLDQTSYYGTVLNADLGKAMHLFADIVRNPKLDAENIDLEKQIIEDENCRGCFNCSMNEAFFEAAYPDQCLSRPVIGYQDSLKNITRDDLQAFHQEFYVGSNITVAVCGDMPHSDVVDLVRSAFKDVPTGNASEWPKLSYSGGDMHMGTSSDTSSVWLGFDVTHFSTAQKRAIWMFTNIVGGHGQSLLMQELREKRGLVYDVSCEVETYARRDVLRLYLQGPSPKIAEICDVTIDTLRNTAENLSNEEHAKAIRRHHLNSLMSCDALEGRVFDMITDISEFGEVTVPNERYKAYQSMSRADIQNAAKTMLDMTPSIVMSAPVRVAPKMASLHARLAKKGGGGLLSGLLKRAG